METGITNAGGRLGYSECSSALGFFFDGSPSGVMVDDTARALA
jgi:hypothetical protein